MAVACKDQWPYYLFPDVDWTPVCNAYWIRIDDTDTRRAPSAWEFQGWDGASWVALDRRQGETSWGGGEVRFYDFVNYTGYSKYRLYVTGTADYSVGQWYIAEMGWAESGDTMAAITFTFSSTTGINNDAGFDADDVDRHLRIRGSDGKWRWVVITAVNSTTEIEGRMYGHSLPDLKPISRWQLGSWKEGQWPAKVCFFEGRRVFARSAVEAQALWLTKTEDFYDFGTSQPLADDDGMQLKLRSNKNNAVTWLAENERLAVGTFGGVRLLGKANQNAGFGATNFDQTLQVYNRASEVKPVQVGSVMLFSDYFGRTVHEFIYDINQDGYVAPDATILSDHLLAAGVVDMAYQAVPDSTIWLVLADGGLVAMTYEREQKIVALTRIEIAGGDADTSAVVESVCSIPGTAHDEVWLIVKRTIGGQTRRFVEVMAQPFEYMDLEDGIFLDSSLSYSGTPIGTLSGLNHLAGLDVYVLGDGVVYRDLTVSAAGMVTLPDSATASVIHAGLPYTATVTTLAITEAGQRDGTGLSRRKLLNDARISVMDTLGLKAKGLTSTDSYDLFLRDQDDPVSGAMLLRTGLYPLNFDMSWRDDGQFTLFSEDPLPATIRGIVFGVTGEP